MSYNDGRISRLMRRLAPEKRDLFKIIPFLLHINKPDLPGYVDNPLLVYGIYDLPDLFFWKFSLKHFGLSEKMMRQWMSRSFHINGLYLMGSSGTVAQGDYSDFDYWVIVDKSRCSDKQLGLLEEKLSLIKSWCEENYSQEVEFFVMDAQDLKVNNFSSVSDESSGTAQKTILKEEFYRTFVYIAGKLPLWAITTPGSGDGEYRAFGENLLEYGGDDERLIDLGNLISIDKNECVGAILWQIFKARKDPVKSLLKSALIACFNFYDDDSKLPCDQLKKRVFDDDGNGQLADPYVVMFRETLSLGRLVGNPSLSRAVEEAVFFRLSGFPIPNEVRDELKLTILGGYLTLWNWKASKISNFKSYKRWTEEKKILYEQSLVRLIAFLYELVLRSSDAGGSGFAMDGSDVKILINKLSVFFKKKPGKIPACSSGLRAGIERRYLFLVWEKDGFGKDGWNVYESFVRTKRTQGTPVFRGPELMRVIAWGLYNKLFEEGDFRLKIETLPSGMTEKCVREIIEKSRSCFTGDRELESILDDPLWVSIFVSIKGWRDNDSRREKLGFVEFVLKNTWNEFYFTSMDLQDTSNRSLQCYRVAQFLFHYIKKKTTGHFALYFNIEGVKGTRELEKMIRGFLHDLSVKNGVAGKTPTLADNKDDPENNDSPFLDLL